MDPLSKMFFRMLIPSGPAFLNVSYVNIPPQNIKIIAAMILLLSFTLIRFSRLVLGAQSLFFQIA